MLKTDWLSGFSAYHNAIFDRRGHSRQDWHTDFSQRIYGLQRCMRYALFLIQLLRAKLKSRFRMSHADCNPVSSAFQHHLLSSSMNQEQTCVPGKDDYPTGKVSEVSSSSPNQIKSQLQTLILHRLVHSDMGKDPPRFAANYSILLDTNSYSRSPCVPAFSKLVLQCHPLDLFASLLTILDVQFLDDPRGFPDVGEVRRRIVPKAAPGNCFSTSSLS